MTTRPPGGPVSRHARRTGLTVGVDCAWLVVGLVWLVAALATDQFLDGMAARRP